ncbi:MAG TPA: response regulator transcription factor [Ktedonobacterales bacterium]|nr:response regulator transcription factor [Ktedonobacterales bacterium]
MATILVVEDDVALSELLCARLEAEGHSVRQRSSGPDALTAIEEQPPDLIILDWMLPGMDGLAVCRRVRAHYLMPILMLTARTEEIDQVLGLEVGADDYITKPFSIRQLLARVGASLRRVELESQRAHAEVHRDGPPDGHPQASQEAPDVLTCGQLTIDRTQHAVRLDGRLTELTPKEYDLLVLLASHPGWVFTREIILQEIWGGDYEGFDRTIDNHIARLRRKLGEMGERIDTIWGVGYRFNRDP